MDNLSHASDVLAPCYPLTCNSEEHASSLLASQKRRDIGNTPNHDEALLGNALTLRPYQSLVVQNLRAALARGSSRVMPCSPTGSGKTEIGMALVKAALANGIADSKGYNAGWVASKYREYFGVWSRDLPHTATEPTAEVRNSLMHLQIRHAKSTGASHALT